MTKQISQAAFRTLLSGLAAFCIAGISRAQLQVTEIMYDPTSAGDNVWEWIEVRNTSGSAINLDGWLAFQLEDGEVTAPSASIDGSRAANTIIPANGVAIIYDGEQPSGSGFPDFEANDASFRSAWGLSPSVPVLATRFWQGLSNTNGSVKQGVGFWSTLANYQADLIPNPDYDPNVPQSPLNIVGSYAHTQFYTDYSSEDFPTPSPGSSLHWTGIGTIHDGTKWAETEVGQPGVVTSVPASVAGTINDTSSVGNPGRVPTGITFPTTGLHITEFLYDAAELTETAWEWVEIYNDSGSTINLAGYVLDDNSGTDLAAANIASGSIPNGGTAILHSSETTDANFKAAWGTGLNVISVTNWSTIALQNTTDFVGLWSSLASYDPDPNSGGAHNTTHQSMASTVAKQRYNEGTGFPVAGQGQSIYLVDPDDPNNGADSWVASSVDDGFRFPDDLGSFNPNGVQGSGGLIPFHLGGDIGSPGSFTVDYDADYNNDGVIDGRDFLTWQRGGSPAPLSSGDLAKWETQYGNPSPVQAVTTAVPEPATFVLCGMALAPLALRRRRS